MAQVILHNPGADFLMPYIRREFPAMDDIQLWDDIAAGATPEAHTAVMISGVEALDGDSSTLQREQAFTAECARLGLRYFILRAAPIVCTGMQGAVRTLAEDIYRGRFFHLPGNDARISVVHAIDIAAAVRHLITSSLPSGIYTVTDGEDPTIHDMAEALAFRMDNKRISTASTAPQQWFLKFIYGHQRLARYTTDAVYSSADLLQTGFTPTPVCSYLRTHIYDHDSL